ncbi:sporulation protein YtxC, partial [Clostridioides difficile]
MVEKDNISSMKFLRNNNVNDRLIYTNDIVEVVIDSAKQEVLNKKILNGTKAEQRALNIDEISTEITSMIISIMKEKLLKEYILKCYGRTYPEDKNNIYIYSLNIFAKKEIFMRETVFTRVRNYIEENDFINVEGFIRFRMREFMKYISAIGDIAVEEYLIKKDQDEFIRVLKY